MKAKNQGEDGSSPGSAVKPSAGGDEPSPAPFTWSALRLGDSQGEALRQNGLFGALKSLREDRIGQGAQQTEFVVRPSAAARISQGNPQF